MKNFAKGYKAVLVLIPLGLIVGIGGGLISSFFIDRWGVDNSLTVALILVTSSAFFYTYRTNKTTVKEMKKNRYADSIPIVLIDETTTHEESATVEANDIKLTNVGKGIATNVVMSYTWTKRSIELSDLNVDRPKEFKMLETDKEEIKELGENIGRIQVEYKDIFGNSFASWAKCTIVGQNDLKLSKWQYKAFIKD